MFKHQWEALKESFCIRSFHKAYFLELSKIIIMALLFFGLAAIAIKILLTMQPLINILAELKTGGITPELEQQFLGDRVYFDKFVLYITLLFAIGIIFYLFISALFDTFTINQIKGEKYDKKKFMMLVCYYALTTLVFLAIWMLFLIKLTNLNVLTVITMILFLLYIYSISIFQITTNSNIGFNENLWNGVKNIIKLHKTIIAIIIMLLVALLLLIVLTLAFKILFAWTIVLFAICYALWHLWSKNYLYKILR